jgi:hypothetical protein
LRDEQRDQAIRTSLQLGAFLCTKMKDDGEFLDRLNQLYSKTCTADSQLDANCARRQEQLGQHQKRWILSPAITLTRWLIWGRPTTNRLSTRKLPSSSSRWQHVEKRT